MMNTTLPQSVAHVNVRQKPGLTAPSVRFLTFPAHTFV
jgi:hypothetical protein